MSEVVITSALRTPIGKFGGVFKNISAIELGTLVLKNAVSKSKLTDDNIDEVILGNVLQLVGSGGNLARQCVVKAGLNENISAYTVNKNCASAMRAVISGVQSILTGDNDVVIAGGFENLSQAPYLNFDHRWGKRMGNTTLQDALSLAYFDPLANSVMGQTAENLAQKYSISRQEQDLWAAMSQQRAEKAIKAGIFKDEIVPVIAKNRKGEEMIIDTDEHPTFGTTIDTLSRLKPVFVKDGTVTAGNSSGINDGAAALTLMAKDKTSQLGVKPLVRVVAYASSGVSPAIMGIGPYYSTIKALEKAGLTLQDIDLIECNEAFAAQVIAVERELKWDRDKVNVNGSGIALGHPVGATGARLIVSLIYEMKRRNVQFGLATLCIGGGQGLSIIIENI